MTKISTNFLWLIIVLTVTGVTSVSWGLSVRVGMEMGEGTVLSSPGGLTFEIEGRSFSVAPTAVVTLETKGDNLWWREKGVTFSQGVVSPGKNHFLFLNNRPYRGQFLLRNNGNGILVINQLSVDDYLKGTIKLEVSPNWPEEALLAQIVVSRTYALRNLGRHREEGFDFCPTTHCQRYGGVNAETELTNRLIEETKGVILTYDDQPATVFFHSESGGFTENAADVWGGSFPYLISVPSPWEEDTPHAHWSLEVERRELEQILQSRGLIRGPINKITLVKDARTKRVKLVRVDTPGGTFPISGHRFREAIGFERLPSTLFDLEVREKVSFLEPRLNSSPEPEAVAEVEPEATSDSALASLPREEWLAKDWDLDDIMFYLKTKEQERAGQPPREALPKPSPLPADTKVVTGSTFVFQGKGYGHGVGFSQWGARGMAMAGFSWKEILTHYFPGCEIERVALDGFGR